MPRSWQNDRGRGLIRAAVAVVGLVLVGVGLSVATWASSSDSRTTFTDLSYGDPPYGFNESVVAEVVARPYFNGGAWMLLGLVAVLACGALARPTASSSVAALVVCLVAMGWSVVAVATLALVDLQYGARMPTLGYLMVAAALVGLCASHLSRPSVWVLSLGALLAAGAAVAVWYWPVNSFDSSCSLATRNRFDNRGACADFYRTQWIWLVGLVVAAVALAVGAAVVARGQSTASGSVDRA